MGARVERGRALNSRACAQDLTGHFGGAAHSADPVDPADPADPADPGKVVACPAGRTLPSTRAGGQDDVSYTNSLNIYIYIYRERERERKRDNIYIYIYARAMKAHHQVVSTDAQGCTCGPLHRVLIITC